jgi:hypothetical protein
MKDFFDYPEDKEVAKKYERDGRLSLLVLVLQDRGIARLYYKD